MREVSDRAGPAGGGAGGIPRWAQTPRAPFLLLAVTLAVWGPVVRGDFHFDDQPNVVRDEATAGGAVLAERLRTGIRPLLRLSYHLDHRLWGVNPAGFLATNLVLHVLTVLGVWALARRRLGSDLAAVAAGAVFALQPADAEVVAYVSGRSTGLMTALVVGGLLCHERAREAGGGAARRHVPWRVLSFAAFTAACFAKEVALIFPALLLLWEWSGEQTARRPRGVLIGTLVLAGCVLVLLAFSPRYRTLARFSLALRGPGESLAVNLRAIPVMLSLWVRPWALSVDHDFDPSPHLAAMVLGAGVLALLAGALFLRGRAPLVALAAGWVLLALAPTNSIVAKLDPVTEKPLYLAWIGPALLLGALVARLRPTVGRRRWALLMAPLLALATWSAAARATTWTDPRRLWADAVAKAPTKARPWANLGVAWMDRDPVVATRALRQALRLDPQNVAARRSLMTLEALCGAECERSR